MRTGFENADGDVVIVQDADLEYDPNEYARLVQPILDGRAQVVYGSRFFVRGARQSGYLMNYLANRFLTVTANLVTGMRMTDMETCYKTLSRDVLRRIQLEQNRFGFDPEITMKVWRQGVRIHEVPISYYARSHS